MSEYYILDGRTPVRASLMEWAQWTQHHERQVAVDRIGAVTVSTVFLGLDHSFTGPPPMIFETLVFEGPLDSEMERYSTMDDAERGHAAMVTRVRAALAALEDQP